MTDNLLEGPRIEPVSGGKAERLVVFLHGYGADGNDLIGLGQQWQQVLPNTAFVSPHAPEPCAMNPFGGRQWFELTMRDPDEYWRGVVKAAPVLNDFLDSELDRYNLDESRLALVGFSQGTMMSLHAGLRRKKGPTCIVGYSGMLAGPENLIREIQCKPPVLLVHGDQDEIIPVQALAIARDALQEAGIAVQWHVSSGIGHGIDGDGLVYGAKFLKEAFDK